MEENSIRKYGEIMRELGLTGLEVSENGNTVRLERTGSIIETPLASTSQSGKTEKSHNDLIDILSPMVGVFYASPAENAASFVQVGDTVHKGDVLGIIEAMKLINEIVAEQSGIIAEICVENNHIVDFGHVLFRLRKGQE